MFRIGQPEIDAFAAVVRSKKLFRYTKGGQCERFEKRYARFLGVKHVAMTSSGSAALTAALAALGLGPGDEVIIPAQTFMATALSVVTVGAIPVIVDIDESIMLDPAALADAVGPRTRAVIPVHMWGRVCDMDAIMRVARRKKLLVIEDACQCAGGAYHGRMVGGIGHAGAFSFNYFKNITCGEGGALVTNDAAAARRAACIIDPCNFFWTGRREDFRPFCGTGSRASEFEGAVINAQLDRLPGMIRTLRRMKNRVLRQTAGLGLVPAKSNSPDGECGSNVVYQFPSAALTARFAKLVGGTILSQTGRHTYTEWDPILTRSGAAHPALDPFRFPENKGCRMNYRKDMCPQSLDILSRSVIIGLHPDRTAVEIDKLIKSIRSAAAAVVKP